MKRLAIMLCALIGDPAYAQAAPVLKLENIKQIVCESTVSYDEDSPNEKTAARGVKRFKPGSRKDVQRRPGAFLLAEVDPDSDEQDAGYDQQFYFSPIKGGKLSFRFIADWKARGELNLGADGTATGFINQKDHITELRCKIDRNPHAARLRAGPRERMALLSNNFLVARAAYEAAVKFNPKECWLL